MLRFFIISLAATMVATVGASAGQARDGRELNQLRDQAEQGKVIPLNRLIADVSSRPPYNEMTYIGGLQYDQERMIYTMKFMDGNRVVLVFVDARTGRVVGRKP